MNVVKASVVPKIVKPRPLLKWAGGKTQLLDELLPLVPARYGSYIEPFIGGGALFFNLQPERGVIADSNPELINLYRSVADDVDAVIDALSRCKNDEAMFYGVREMDWMRLSPADAAARTIYLNKTCFNGLYRVNRQGQFNVPFGKYANPRILDEDSLRAASALLQRTDIAFGDYKAVLKEKAKPGDFVFLDPPYLPVSEYADFKRYTKEQFYEEDHVDLANEVERLHQLGCHVILTNSNHPLVHELYSRHEIRIVKTNRHISSKSDTRKGEDVIVNIPPKRRAALTLVPRSLPDQVQKYPSTRYMGSKSKILTDILSIASQFQYDQFVDLFSGSGIVGYMMKAEGKTICSNDYMAMSATFAKAMIENNSVILPIDEAQALLKRSASSDRFVEKTFKDLYFSDTDNRLIDNLRANIKTIAKPQKRAIAMAALIRACMKKRPRGIFTYIGDRYDDGRKDLSLSFVDQFVNAVKAINEAVFDNGRNNKARMGDALSFKPVKDALVYIDPPYYSPLSDNEYVRRYHFVEGLARDWEGVEIQEHTLTKKFKSYPTPFSSKKGAESAFDHLFKRFRDNFLLISYSSNSQPSLDEMVALLSRYKAHVDVVPIDYKYSFGNQAHKVGDNKNDAQEYLFIGY